MSKCFCIWCGLLPRIRICTVSASDYPAKSPLRNDVSELYTRGRARNDIPRRYPHKDTKDRPFRV
jgi:hypothetical protein